ncbi:MAG: hypothetical protein KKC68_04430, partial [Candidatus Thermoplasmatota archaeon]|nr:hypothetical protein [Candidatus Thermoplasmatota archaeon]
TTYYWFIIAEDNHGASAIGPLWEFTTEAPQNHPPHTPSDPYPAHQATNVPLKPTLNWTGGDPDVGDTVTYDVCFGATNPPTKIIANQTTTDYTPGNLSLGTIYYWQIIAWDNHDETTPGIVWEFTTQTDTNLPPDIPLIGGYVRGRAGITYTYSVSCTDPDSDNFYLYVDWGDETTTGWTGSYTSGDEIILQHSWTNVGTYLIRAKAKDIHDAEGDWGHLSITMPLRNTYIASIFEQIIHNLCTRFPRLATILNQMLY